MPLRVTQGMIQNQMLRNLNHNFERMSGLENQLSTGRKINKPSDDPVGITYALRYRSELSMNDQYQRNITEATSAVSHLDNVLDQVNDLIKRIKELAIRGISDSSPESARSAIGQELDGVYKQLFSLGNDQMNGKFIFNGQKTTTAPYDIDNAAAQDTDDSDILLPVAPGVQIATNVTGSKVFGASTDPDNLFRVINEIKQGMLNNDPDRAEAVMDALDTRLDTFLGVRAEVGARANRVEMLDNRNQLMSDTLNGLSGKTEDADIDKTIMNLKRDENVYLASLSTAARLIQPSLVDYLR